MFPIEIKDCYETRDLDRKYPLLVGEHAIAKGEKHLDLCGRPMRETASRILSAASCSSLLHVERTFRYEHLRSCVIQNSLRVPIPIVLPVIFDPQRNGYVIKTLLIDAECFNQSWMALDQPRFSFLSFVTETRDLYHDSLAGLNDEQTKIDQVNQAALDQFQSQHPGQSFRTGL